MEFFVIGIRNENGDFVIPAGDGGPIGQIIGENEARGAFNQAAHEHGVTNVWVFQLADLGEITQESEEDQSVGPTCPECGRKLERNVFQPGGNLNRDQWDADKAGNWRCPNKYCPGIAKALIIGRKGNLSNDGHVYYFDHELGL